MVPVMRTTRILLPALLAASLAVGACSGGDGDENADDDVATLGADDSGGDDSDDAGGGNGGRGIDPEFQDAMLEYAECMREQGIDFPDPQMTEDGGVIVGGAASRSIEDESGGGGPSLSDMEEMEDADAECRHIMEEVEGSMPELDPEQQAEMQDQALEFAQCMREHGIDMPDPEFDGDGGNFSISLGGPDDAGRIDPSDDDFQEASEECGGEGGFGGPMIGVGAGPDEDDG